MCAPMRPLMTEPNWVVIPIRLTNPSGLSWRVPNFNIRDRL
jgi:hypothetical protein